MGRLLLKASIFAFYKCLNFSLLKFCLRAKFAKPCHVLISQSKVSPNKTNKTLLRHNNMSSLENRHINRTWRINLGRFFSFLLFDLHINNNVPSIQLCLLPIKAVFFFYFCLLFSGASELSLVPIKMWMEAIVCTWSSDWLTTVLEDFEAGDQQDQAFGSRSYTRELDTATFEKL